MKPCKNCKLLKPLEDFSKNKCAKDGYQAWCKECCSGYYATARSADDQTFARIRHSKAMWAQKYYLSLNISSKKRRFETQAWLRRVKKLLLVIYRDTCQLCGSHEALEMHHILPVKTFPDSTKDIQNIIILCEECHTKKVHPGGNLKKIDPLITAELLKIATQTFLEQEITW